MASEDKLDREIKESAEFRGEVRQYMHQTEGWIKGVSQNQKEVAARLDAHIQDTKAHGAEVRAQGEDRQGKSVDRWIAVGAAILSCGMLAIEMVKAFGK